MLHHFILTFADSYFANNIADWTTVWT